MPLSAMCIARSALGFLALLIITAAAQHKGATVTLHARWNGTSLLAEAAEFLVFDLISITRWQIATIAHAQADEDPELFWKYLDLLGQQGSIDKPTDPDECWTHMMAHAESLLPSAIARVGCTV